MLRVHVAEEPLHLLNVPSLAKQRPGSRLAKIVKPPTSSYPCGFLRIQQLVTKVGAANRSLATIELMWACQGVRDPAMPISALLSASAS